MIRTIRFTVFLLNGFSVKWFQQYYIRVSAWHGLSDLAKL